MQCNYGCHERRDDELKFVKLAGFDQFHASLAAAKVLPTSPVQEHGIRPQFTGHTRLLASSVFEETIHTVETKPWPGNFIPTHVFFSVSNNTSQVEKCLCIELFLSPVFVLRFSWSLCGKLVAVNNL